MSALGVEEQRVRVISDFEGSPTDRMRMGDGYRVIAEFVLWEGAEVLSIPSRALFRTASGAAVFVVDRGRAERRRVTVGRDAGLYVQVLEGLEEGESVIIHPSHDLENSRRVRVQSGHVVW